MKRAAMLRAPEMPARCLLLALVLAATPSLAAAQSTPGLDVRIERDTRPTSIDNGLNVNLLVTITEHATGLSPRDHFEVYTSATYPNEPETSVNACGEIRDNDPDAKPGIYRCTVVVDHGGTWNFVAVVNEKRRNPAEQPRTLTHTSVQIPIETNAVAPDIDKRQIRGSMGTVAILFGHSAVALAWLLSVAALTVLALPGSRRHLSSLALHRLEGGIDFILKANWTATALTIGSGVYLLLKETAYKAPFSSSAIRNVFALPFAKPYFLSLWTKIALYAVMAPASVLIARAARRQQRLDSGRRAPSQPLGQAAPERLAIWRGEAQKTPHPSGGRTLLAPPVAVPTQAGEQAHTKDPQVVVQEVSPTGARLAAVAVSAGGVGIWICVTLLKYFHQLIEAK